MDNKPIYLEPFVNDAGRLVLMDSESKREIAFTQSLTLINDEEELQHVSCRIIVDPRSRPG